MSAFKYDVAITAADFDALAVAELRRRLEPRVSKPIFSATRQLAPDTRGASSATARKAFEKDARVVVVLYQRLWGTTPDTADDALALKARIGKVKHKDVLIVSLDGSPLPAWLKGTPVKLTDGPTGTPVIDAIVSAVGAAGGAKKRVTEAHVAALQAEEENRAKARMSFLTSQRALTLINRELDSLSAAVLKLFEAPGTLPEGMAPSVRRTPDRYTVQLGPVGLSFSWIRGRSQSIADGQLLVIEWSGQLGEQHSPTDPRKAMPAFEHVLQPHATSPDDWQWRRMDLDLVCYTTRDLAGQCVASVVRRLPGV
jgi:hypothetical protein